MNVLWIAGALSKRDGVKENLWSKCFDDRYLMGGCKISHVLSVYNTERKESLWKGRVKNFMVKILANQRKIDELARNEIKCNGEELFWCDKGDAQRSMNIPGYAKEESWVHSLDKLRISVQLICWAIMQRKDGVKWGRAKGKDWLVG